MTAPSLALPILFGLMLGIAALQSFGWPGVLVLICVLGAWELAYDLKLYRRERTEVGER